MVFEQLLIRFKEESVLDGALAKDDLVTVVDAFLDQWLKFLTVHEGATLGILVSMNKVSQISLVIALLTQ